MSEFELYTELVLTRQSNPLPEDAVTELHHIWPRSCGGPDEEWNRVRLTPEEHFQAHQLLSKIYVDPRCRMAMCSAAWLMAHTRDGIEVSAEEYGELKRSFVKLMKERKPPMLGRHLTEEQRRHYSDAAKKRPHFFKKGRTPWNKGKRGLQRHTEEWKKAQSERSRGRHHTEETKAKLSEIAKQRTSYSFAGHHHTEEAKQRDREAHLGTHHSAETKAKLSAMGNARWAAKSPERAAADKERLAKVRPQKPIVVSKEGVDQAFPNIKEACRVLSLEYEQVRRCLSPKYSTSQHKGYTFRLA